MRRSGVVVLIWGVINTVLASLLWIFSSPATDWLSYVEAYGMALGCITLGLVILWIAARGEPATEADTGPRYLTELSLATTCLGLGLFGLMLSTEFGFWLALISAGVVALGLGGLLREWLGMRRAR